MAQLRECANGKTLKISKVMVALLEQPEACRRQRGRTYLNACGQRIRMYLILQPTSSAGTKCRQNLSSSMPNGRRTGSARFSSSLQNNFPDPNDKTIRQQLIITLIKRLPRFQYQQRGQLEPVAEITTKSGMLPTQIKTMLTAGATSRDPAVVVPMAKMYGQILTTIRRRPQVLIKARWRFTRKFMPMTAPACLQRKQSIWPTTGLSAGRSLEADD